ASAAPSTEPETSRVREPRPSRGRSSSCRRGTLLRSRPSAPLDRGPRRDGRGPRFLSRSRTPVDGLTLRECAGTVAAMSSRGASWITAAAVAALAFAVFANSLSNGLTAEDTAAIVGAAAHHPLDWRALLSTPAGNVYRPLTAWTFAVDHALHGDQPFGYHLMNVLGHAGAAALVVLLARALGLSVVTTGLAGALFAVHPIHGDAVASAAGRSVILAAGLALLSR